MATKRQLDLSSLDTVQEHSHLTIFESDSPASPDTLGLVAGTIPGLDGEGAHFSSLVPRVVSNPVGKSTLGKSTPA